MFCKTGLFKNFEKITGKHLCRSLGLNKVSVRDVSQNSQNSKENNYDGVSFLTKLQAEKNRIILKKTPVLESGFK